MDSVPGSPHTCTRPFRHNNKPDARSSRYPTRSRSGSIDLSNRVVKPRARRGRRSRSSSSSTASTSTPASASARSSISSARTVPIASLYLSDAHIRSHPELTTPPKVMSKLSEGLKALISAPHARPGYTRAPSNIKSVLTQFARDAQAKKVGMPAWVTISTAASMTLNCPEAMTQLLSVTREIDTAQRYNPVTTAELIREVGLKCISFNGIPRSINCLGAFYNDLPADIKAGLSTKPTREYTPANLESRIKDGYNLWDSVYHGFERKLLNKLAQSHPDLPVHIIHSHYSNLLSDPPPSQSIPGAKVGRVLTSIVAIACLRSQTGVGPQVTSHVFGLRKAYEHGGAFAEGEEPVEGGEWLATEEGNRWILESLDSLISAIVGGAGTSFAPGLRPKL